MATVSARAVLRGTRFAADDWWAGLRSARRLARPEGSGQGVAMEFRILGSFEVVGSAGALDLRGAKRRGLLACLVVHAGQPMSTDRLVEELWGDGLRRRGANGADLRVPAAQAVPRRAAEAWKLGQGAMCSRSTPATLTPTASSKDSS